MKLIKEYDAIILDCYNVFARWNAKTGEKTVMMEGKSVHVEGIVGFLTAVETYIKKFAKDENTRIYFLFDNAKTIYERKEISDAYKAERKKNQPAEWYYRELDFCELICHYYRNSSYLFRVPSFEADDFVKNVIRSYVKKDEKALMISTDMDWSRYLSDSVHQWKDHVVWTPEYFESVYGFKCTESNITFYKSFYGDESDNIKGFLPNLPKMLFKDIIFKYNSMSQFISDIRNIDFLDSGWKAKIEEEKNNLLMNWTLVSSAEIGDSELSCYRYRCSYKPKKLSVIYSALSVIGIVDERIKPKSRSSSIFDMLDGEIIGRKQS